MNDIKKEIRMWESCSWFLFIDLHYRFGISLEEKRVCMYEKWEENDSSMRGKWHFWGNKKG